MSESIFKFATNQRYIYAREFNAEKPLSRLPVFFIFEILLKMHERDTAKEEEFDTVLQIILLS